MAFTTTTGAGGTSLIGTSGVDTTTITTLSTAYVGAQGDNDVVSFSNASGLASLTAYNVNMGAGNDTFSTSSLTAQSSTVEGNDGNDTLTFAAVTSSRVGGGNDNDAINVSGAINSSILNGNGGIDTFTVSSATVTSSSIYGGQGNDIINLSGNAFTSSVVNGQVGNDTITTGANTLASGMSRSTIFGGQGDDTLNFANAAQNVYLSGDNGADIVTAGTGDDTLLGGDGADVITGGTNTDLLSGGTGIDRFNQAVGDSVAATTAGVVNLVFGTSAATTADVVTDFIAGIGGDILDVDSIAASNIGAAFTTAAPTAAAAGTYLYSGTWNAATFTFSIAANGPDTLVYQSSALNQAVGTNLSSLILTGTLANSLVASNFA